MSAKGSTKSGGTPQIPDRMFFKIGDVSEIAGVETHVLRFWESEFPTLRPRKTSSGQRQYRRKDVETVLSIKELLYQDGYTIAGARRVLRTGARSRAGAASADGECAAAKQRAFKKALQEIRSELKQILELVKP